MNYISINFTWENEKNKQSKNICLYEMELKKTPLNIKLEIIKNTWDYLMFLQQCFI